MSKVGVAAAVLFSFAAGFAAGAASIHRPMPGAPLELPPARKPWKPRDLLGLAGSVGIRALSGHLVSVPSVILETDKSFALELPSAGNRVHYVILPKKDISDIGQASTEDQPYLMDMFLVARKIVEKEGLSDYRLFTNGPGKQSVAYLHFHLMGKRGRT